MVAIFGHRGARGLLPENALSGFGLANALELTGVEFDVGVTKDGVVVVHHDPRLNQDVARDKQGAYVGADAPLLRDLSFAELQGYDVGRLREGSAYAARFAGQIARDGTRIPSFDAVLEVCEPLDLLVEIKSFPDRPEATLPPAELVAHTLAGLRAAGAVERSVLYCFDWRVLEEAKKQAPELRRCCLTEPGSVAASDLWFGGTSLAAHGNSVPRAVASTGAVVWAPFHEMLDEAQLAEAKALGLTVIPWTVNEPADFERMLDLGVDGIITDVPDLALEILDARGEEPAQPGFVTALRR